MRSDFSLNCTPTIIISLCESESYKGQNESTSSSVCSWYLDTTEYLYYLPGTIYRGFKEADDPMLLHYYH